MEVADKLASSDPDYSIRDLFNAIAEGKPPSWTVYLQVREKHEYTQRGLHFMDAEVVVVWGPGHDLRASRALPLQPLRCD